MDMDYLYPLILPLLLMLMRRRVMAHRVEFLRCRRLCVERCRRRNMTSILSLWAARKRRRTHRIWQKQRLRTWFSNEVMTTWGDERWIECFRMSKGSFLKLCNLLRNDLSPCERTVRAPLPLENRVAIALYALSSCGEFVRTANQFGCQKTSVWRHMHAFVRAVDSSLADYISLPGPDEAKQIASRWQAKYAYPQCFGALDGTHIPLRPAADGRADHINRKGWASINLQAVVDDKYLFRYVSVGAPGSWHDASVLRTSSLFTKSGLLPKESVVLAGEEVRLHIVGDAAYPLLPWLLKPYPAARASEVQDSYNSYLSSGRMSVECAFGRLKGRWRRIFKPLDHGADAAARIVQACCILHNFCEQQKERFYEHWIPDSRGSSAASAPAPSRQPQDMRAADMRNAICQFLADNYPLRKSTF